MSEKLIKVTKQDGTHSIVPATQKSTYESFNARATKLKRKGDIVTIEDYDGPAAISEKAGQADATQTQAGGQAPKQKTALEVIDLISKAISEAEVATIVEGDTRVTVLKAADDKIATFVKPE